MNTKLWPRLIQALIVLSLPIALLVVNTRIATGHWFVHWEYHKANFPPDPYGFSTAERTHLAEVSIDYLAQNAPLSLLGDLRLPDGNPAFNERELRHMADVQVVYSQLMAAGAVAGLVVLWGSVALVFTRGLRSRAPAALVGGSLLTLGLLIVIGAYMVLQWDTFFTTFHRIFFAGDTWLFPTSDTLIRLFPMELWIDVAVVIVGPLVAEAVLIGVAAWVWLRRARPVTLQTEGE